MKLLLLLLNLFGHVFIFAQSSDKVVKAWDSLRFKTAEEIKRYDDNVRNECVYVDTLTLLGSVTITYFNHDKLKLKQVIENLDSNNCIIGVQTGYYNSKGLLIFRSGHKKCCQQDTVDGYKCFERIADYERLEYDEVGRLKMRVFHVTTPMTYREYYTYTTNGIQQVQRTRINETQFWE